MKSLFSRVLNFGIGPSISSDTTMYGAYGLMRSGTANIWNPLVGHFVSHILLLGQFFISSLASGIFWMFSIFGGNLYVNCFAVSFSCCSLISTLKIACFGCGVVIIKAYKPQNSNQRLATHISIVDTFFEDGRTRVNSSSNTNLKCDVSSTVS